MTGMTSEEVKKRSLQVRSRTTLGTMNRDGATLSIAKIALQPSKKPSLWRAHSTNPL
jgi:hypothetical protein